MTFISNFVEICPMFLEICERTQRWPPIYVCLVRSMRNEYQGPKNEYVSGRLVNLVVNALTNYKINNEQSICVTLMKLL